MSISLLQAVTAINDATMLITALGPLVQRALENGEDTVSMVDVEIARGNLVKNIDALDALIEKAKQPE